MEFKLNELTDGRRTENTPSYDTSTYMQCPYKGEHTIELSRMQFHLKKCRKAFPDIPKKNCPFDRTHWVNEPELEFHMKSCPKRKAFDEYKYSVGENSTLSVDPPPAPPVPVPEENWDSMAAAAYDPEQGTEGRNLVRKIHGAQPAERKRFRMEQRQRYGREN